HKSQKDQASFSQSLHPLAPGLARPGRAYNVMCCVEPALSAGSTQHIKTGGRRRREPAIMMGNRKTHRKLAKKHGQSPARSQSSSNACQPENVLHYVEKTGTY